MLLNKPWASGWSQSQEQMGRTNCALWSESLKRYKDGEVEKDGKSGKSGGGMKMIKIYYTNFSNGEKWENMVKNNENMVKFENEKIESNKNQEKNYWPSDIGKENIWILLCQNTHMELNLHMSMYTYIYAYVCL